MAATKPKSSLSTLAETAEEYIKLECVRRRNQPLTRRRSMLQEQYQVAAPMTRLKERVAQTRHHEFLMRSENRVLLETILDRVRDLMEELSTPPVSAISSTTDRRRSSAAPILNPMDHARLKAWVGDTERIMTDFDASDSHENDPIVRVVEQLQKLQDGPVCLAEVVVDARALLEQWERSGVFDNGNDDSGDDESSDTDGPIGRIQGVTRPARQLDQSYAYQNIRQRAAASCIKRNVLRWVRSKESFCERVAEIELFGQTTESFLKELTSTSKSFAAAMENESPHDIFSVVRGRRLDRFAGSIALGDLMHFAKHVALYPVDQALRTLDAMARKRRLLDMRCAVKIQSTWRKARGIFQARRMFQAMELLRIQREQEAAALAELVAVTKASTPKNGKRKSTKPIAKKIRTSFALQSAATSNTTTGPADNEDNDNVRPSSKGALLEGRVRASLIATKRKTSETVVTSDQRTPTNGTPRAKQRAHGNHGNALDEVEVVDTSDVENAWKAFMDTVQLQEENEAKMEIEAALAQISDCIVQGSIQEAPSIVPEVVVSMPSIDDNGWNNWSDDEDGAFSSGEHTFEEIDRVTSPSDSVRRRLSKSKSSRPSTRQEEESRDITRHNSGVIKQQIETENVRRFGSRLGSIVSTADLIKRLEQRPRLERSSVLVPFADWQINGAEQTTRNGLTGPITPASLASSGAFIAAQPLRHLHEIDFSRMYTELDGIYAFEPLVDDHDEDTETWQQTEETQVRVDPSIAPTIDQRHVYRHRYQLPQRRLIVQSIGGSVNTQVAEDTYCSDAKFPRSPRDKAARPELRIYRAPASRQNQMVAKRPNLATPSPAEDEAVQGKMAEHSEWIRSLDTPSSRHAQSELSSPTAVPTDRIKSSGMPMGRKRRLLPSRHPVAEIIRETNQSFPHSNSQHKHAEHREGLPHLTTSRSEKSEGSPSINQNKDFPREKLGKDAVVQVPLHELRRPQKFRTDMSSDPTRSGPSNAASREEHTRENSSMGSKKIDSTRAAQTASIPTNSNDFDARFMSSQAPGRKQRRWRLPRRRTEVKTAEVANFRVEKEIHPDESSRARHAPTPRVRFEVNDRATSAVQTDQSIVSTLDGKGIRQPHPPVQDPPKVNTSVSEVSIDTVTENINDRYPLVSNLPRRSLRAQRGVQLNQQLAFNTLQTVKISSPSPTNTPNPLDPITTPFPGNDPRAAVFSKLLQQYLGLLQCSPTVAH